MIRVVVVSLVVATKMKMRSRRVTFRLCNVGSVMRVRKAQTLVGQHQRNEQYAKESVDHVRVTLAFLFPFYLGHNGCTGCTRIVTSYTLSIIACQACFANIPAPQTLL